LTEEPLDPPARSPLDTAGRGDRRGGSENAPYVDPERPLMQSLSSNPSRLIG
jgi:hypothetical protein